MAHDGHEFAKSARAGGCCKVRSLEMAFLMLSLSNMSSRLSMQQLQSAPSGIAQLRKSSSQTVTGPSMDNLDPMNLDDYIFSDNISTPDGLGQSPSQEVNKKDFEKPSSSVASAIPIKMRKESTVQFAIPQSVPVPHHHPRGNDEFNYVQRHVRKTSIDERRVSRLPLAALSMIASFATNTDTYIASETACRFLSSRTTCQ